jgi:hypothetical protein
MTTAFAVGAASHEPRNWQAVDWRAATGNVRRLQVRIAKAVREGRQDTASPNAASRERRSGGLSRVSWKLSCAVLRGADGGNAVRLLDRKEGKAKQPFLIRRRDKTPIAFAGLWETWQNPASREPLETFTIITTAANELMRPIHERMPLILSPAAFDEWLAPGEPPIELLATLETPEFEAVPVSSWVNSPTHDDAKCMEPTP